MCFILLFLVLSSSCTTLHKRTPNSLPNLISFFAQQREALVHMHDHGFYLGCDREEIHCSKEGLINSLDELSATFKSLDSTQLYPYTLFERTHFRSESWKEGETFITMNQLRYTQERGSYYTLIEIALQKEETNFYLLTTEKGPLFRLILNDIDFRPMYESALIGLGDALDQLREASSIYR